jgi:GNAT superfamily N-acetyltransferase
MSISLQKATLQDSGFIFSLAQNGARNGHFNPQTTLDKTALRAYIQSIITKGVDLSGYASEFSVAFLQGTRIGVTLVTAAIGIPDRGVELAMIALKKEFRGAGYGSLILDSILDRYLPSMSVYARCYPASHQLQQMLVRRDFTEAGTSQGSVILRHGAIGYISTHLPANLSPVSPGMLK